MLDRILSNYSQRQLLIKINQYLKNHNLPLLNSGYCHGLTLVWLKKMAERKEQWFYDMVHFIVNSTDDKLKEFNADIEKFIAKIEYAQNSEKHTMNLFNGIEDEIITYDNIHQILEVKEQKNKDKLYTKKQLSRLYSTINGQNNSLVLTGGFPIKHTIAVFYRDENYFLYNSNNINGDAVIVSNHGKIMEWVQKALYTSFGDPIPSEMDLEVKQLHLPCNSLKRKASFSNSQPQAKYQKTSSMTPRLFTKQNNSKQSERLPAAANHLRFHV